MLKNLITVSMLSIVLLFSACGGDSAAEGALVLQEKLDNGDFSGVINDVEPGASTSADYIMLATAYMGRAGFSFSSIIGIVVHSSESGESSTFASFIEEVESSSNNSSLRDLKIAVEYYKKIVEDKCLDENAMRSGAESDVCLYMGLSEVTRIAVAIGYLTDDIAALSDTNKRDSKLLASTCAMQYAFDGDRMSNVDCTISSESNVTFTESSKEYADINVTVKDKNNVSLVFEYLISGVANPRSTIITNGFCTATDFSTRISVDNNLSTFYACPIDETNTSVETTTADILVNALNNGIDSIAATVSDNVSEGIEQFRKDIISDRPGNDANTTITTEDIINYLAKQNKG